MKNYLFLLLAMALPAATNASSLNDNQMGLTAVEQALGSGQSVTVAIDLSHCGSATGEKERSKTRGGLRINAYRLLEDGTLAFADEHMTVDLGGKPIVQLLRYKVHQDGNAEFTMTVFSLPGYTQVGDPSAFSCKINEGLSFSVSH